MKQPDHIEGLKGREPVGAAVTIGVKHQAKGYPIEKDRFHIVLPYEADGRREHHPAFNFYNAAPADKRRVLMGNLVHRTRADCFEHHLKAQVLGRSKAHPDRRPACIGDGVKAIRWMGDDQDNFAEIQCPNSRCEYRLTTPPSCKPWMRFLFRLRWNDARHPAMLVKLTSGSWNTTRNFLGFFQHIEKTARQLGISDPALFGLPFTLTLVERTKASAKTRFPTVSISPDIDPVDWFSRQRLALLETASDRPVALPDPDQQALETIADDLQTIDVPRGMK